MMKKTEKYINKLVWALRGPIIVFRGYESMQIPASIKEKITLERLIYCMRDEEMAPDVEALWYISTASLIHPLSLEWVNIMMYLTRKFQLSLGKKRSELPSFLREQIVLDEHMEEPELKRLREWIYRKSMNDIVRKAKEEKRTTDAKVQLTIPFA